MERRLIPGHSPYEPLVGYSRAVTVGPHVFVSGTAPIPPDGGEPPAAAYEQARLCLAIIAGALEQTGAGVEHIVRTRIYLTRGEDMDDVARAHGEVFREIRPASTAIVVKELLDPRWRVEIEAEALVP
ncbi:MAG: RidA family protein [Gaiellaceae bacterium]|jgi:enamine deaminase RidA (YjgF/YER057c/UK114 family)